VIASAKGRLSAIRAAARQLALALSASAALAAETHVFAASFGSEGSGAGQLKEPSGLAVDEATHDVYVADSGNNHARRFDLIGAPA
jgi:DNA-binding beta-propeller fold protein YncE